MKDTLALKGRWRLRIRNPDGSVAEERKGENRVVVTGFELAAALLAGEAVTVVSEMRAGDDGTEPTEDDTDLQGTTVATVSTSLVRTNHVLEYTADFAALGTDQEVSEFGLFNSASTMFSRFTTTTFTLFAGQNMDIVWEIRAGK